MQRYERRLLAYIKRIVNIALADAEDILQEVFIKVYQNLNGFDRKLKFSSWIYRITHNQAISHYRRQKSRPKTLSSEDSEKMFEILVSDLDIEEEVQQKMKAEKIHQLLKKLDKKYRDVLVLKFLEDKDYREISDILQKPMGTIATLINRAKKKFKKLLIKHNIEYLTLLDGKESA